MTTATVGALKVVLNADSAQFSKGMKQAEGTAQKFGAVIGKAAGVAAAFGAAAAAAAALVAAQMRSVANRADELGKAAQRVGFLSEELSQLKYTSEMAGVGFESLQSSIVTLTKAMSDVSKGGETDAAKAFEALGVSVKNADGSMRTASEVMGDVAAKFAEYKDGAEKTALAVALFGQAGVQMIPMLNQGREAIEKSNQEARDFGVTMSDNLVNSSSRLNDALSRIGSAFTGIWYAIGERLIPIFADWAVKIADTMKEMRLFETAGKTMQWVIDKIGESVTWVTGRLSGLGSIIQGLANAAVDLKNGEAGKAWESLKLGAQGYADAVQAASDKIDIMRRSQPATVAPFTHDDVLSTFRLKPNAPGLPSKPAKGKGGSGDEDPFAQQREQIEQRLAIIKEGFMSERELLVQKFEEDQNVIDGYYQTQLEKFQGNKEMELQLAQEHNSLMQQLEVEHQNKMDKIRQMGFSQVLTGTARLFDAAGRVAQASGKKNVKIQKALAISSGLISTFDAALKAQAFAATAGPGAAFAAYAAVLAKGLTAVASIQSISESGGGGGGGRGAGGGSYSAPAQAAPEQARPAMHVTLTGHDIFSRETIRGLFEKISEFQKDGGGRIVFG